MPLISSSSESISFSPTSLSSQKLPPDPTSLIMAQLESIADSSPHFVKHLYAAARDGKINLLLWGSEFPDIVEKLGIANETKHLPEKEPLEVLSSTLQQAALEGTEMPNFQKAISTKDTE